MSSAADVVLAALLALAVVTIVVLARQLTATRKRVAELEQLEAAVRVAETRNPRAVQAAGFAVRTAVETVARFREQGVRGMLLSSIDDFATWASENRTVIARVAGPDGTVTIMFSDIESSTALNSELGDEDWVKLLAAHDRLVNTFVDRHRGQVVKSQGDGYMMVFSTPQLALAAALDIQRALSAKRQRSRALRRTPLRVRIGLHSGTAIERDGDYFGRNVAMAARVASMADGGEVMASTEVAEAVAGSTAFRCVQDEIVELKGLPGQHQLWLVVAG